MLPSRGPRYNDRLVARCWKKAFLFLIRGSKQKQRFEVVTEQQEHISCSGGWDA